MEYKKLSSSEIISINDFKSHFEKEFGFTFYKPSYSAIFFVKYLHSNNHLKKFILPIEEYLLNSMPIYFGINDN